MSAEAQLDYVNGLWGRVLAHAEDLPLPDWHHNIIADRLAEYRAGLAGAGRPWVEVRKDLRAELEKVRR
jgi:hypothetical protein